MRSFINNFLPSLRVSAGLFLLLSLHLFCLLNHNNFITAIFNYNSFVSDLLHSYSMIFYFLDLAYKLILVIHTGSDKVQKNLVNLTGTSITTLYLIHLTHQLHPLHHLDFMHPLHQLLFLNSIFPVYR